MMKFEKQCSTALGFLLAINMFAAGQDSLSEPSPRELEVRGLEVSLRRLHLRDSDFGFRDDYMPPDSFALKEFLRLNHDPLEVSVAVSRWREIASGDSPVAVLREMESVATAEHGLARANVAEAPANLMRGINLYYQDEDLNRLLGLLYELTIFTLPAATDSAFSLMSARERRFLHETLPQQLLEDELAYERDMFAHDSIQKLEREQLQFFAGFGSKARPEFLITEGTDAFELLMKEIQRLVTALYDKQVSIQEFLRVGAEIPDRATGTPYLGRQRGWVVGGTGNDHHEGEFTVIIDFGGDDTYDLTFNPERPHPTIIIDLAGNDVYQSKGSFNVGAGVMSFGALFDWSGDDVYHAASFGLGCGWFGVGVLYDRGGDDTYIGDTFTQGAGGFGLGLLYDGAGRDSYSASLLSQAVGFTRGVGILVDKTGNDDYSAGRKYSDVLRYDNHYLSLSQGFGYGLRPYLSGGIGGLIDLAGNDNYTADIFGQACSYWRGFGFIAESEGNDHYVAHQYAQGSATHMTLGALVDFAGDDFYLSKGVSQGCGHDYSLGILSDRGGNDIYHAVDLSQAAGSANGVGLLTDISGNDRYHITNPANTHGYGNPRREFGSIGLLVDLHGEDIYDGHGADNSLWFADGLWGGGMDCDWRLWFPEWSEGDREQ